MYRNLLDTLTEHESAVYQLLLTGATRSEIGKQLFITESGVKFHLANIYNKLGVHSRAEAVAYALLRGVVAEVQGGSTASAAAVAPGKVVGAAGCGWSEAQIREAAGKVVLLNLADRKLVNELVTDLLLALKGQI